MSNDNSDTHDPTDEWADDRGRNDTLVEDDPTQYRDSRVDEGGSDEFADDRNDASEDGPDAGSQGSLTPESVGDGQQSLGGGEAEVTPEWAGDDNQDDDAGVYDPTDEYEQVEESSSIHAPGDGRRKTLDAIEAKGRLDDPQSFDSIEEMKNAVREISLAHPDGRLKLDTPDRALKAIQSTYDALPEDARDDFLNDHRLYVKIRSARNSFNDWLGKLNREAEIPSTMEAGPSNYPAKKANDTARYEREAKEELNEAIDKIRAAANGAEQRALEAVGTSKAEQNEKEREQQREQGRKAYNKGSLVFYSSPGGGTLLWGVKRVNKKSLRLRRPHPDAGAPKPMGEGEYPEYMENRAEFTSNRLKQGPIPAEEVAAFDADDAGPRMAEDSIAVQADTAEEARRLVFGNDWVDDNLGPNAEPEDTGDPHADDDDQYDEDDREAIREAVQDDDFPALIRLVHKDQPGAYLDWEKRDIESIEDWVDHYDETGRFTQIRGVGPATNEVIEAAVPIVEDALESSTMTDDESDVYDPTDEWDPEKAAGFARQLRAEVERDDPVMPEELTDTGLAPEDLDERGEWAHAEGADEAAIVANDGEAPDFALADKENPDEIENQENIMSGIYDPTDEQSANNQTNTDKGEVIVGQRSLTVPEPAEYGWDERYIISPNADVSDGQRGTLAVYVCENGHHSVVVEGTIVSNKWGIKAYHHPDPIPDDAGDMELRYGPGGADTDSERWSITHGNTVSVAGSNLFDEKFPTCDEVRDHFDTGDQDGGTTSVATAREWENAVAYVREHYGDDYQDRIEFSSDIGEYADSQGIPRHGGYGDEGVTQPILRFQDVDPADAYHLIEDRVGEKEAKDIAAGIISFANDGAARHDDVDEQDGALDADVYDPTVDMDDPGPYGGKGIPDEVQTPNIDGGPPENVGNLYRTGEFEDSELAYDHKGDRDISVGMKEVDDGWAVWVDRGSGQDVASTHDSRGPAVDAVVEWAETYAGGESAPTDDGDELEAESQAVDTGEKSLYDKLRDEGVPGNGAKALSRKYESMNDVMDERVGTIYEISGVGAVAMDALVPDVVDHNSMKFTIEEARQKGHGEGSKSVRTDGYERGQVVQHDDGRQGVIKGKSNAALYVEFEGDDGKTTTSPSVLTVVADDVDDLEGGLGGDRPAAQGADLTVPDPWEIVNESEDSERQDSILVEHPDGYTAELWVRGDDVRDGAGQWDIEYTAPNGSRRDGSGSFHDTAQEAFDRLVPHIKEVRAEAREHAAQAEEMEATEWPEEIGRYDLKPDADPDDATYKTRYLQGYTINGAKHGTDTLQIRRWQDTGQYHVAGDQYARKATAIEAAREELESRTEKYDRIERENYEDNKEDLPAHHVPERVAESDASDDQDDDVGADLQAVTDAASEGDLTATLDAAGLTVDAIRAERHGIETPADLLDTYDEKGNIEVDMSGIGPSPQSKLDKAIPAIREGVEQGADEDAQVGAGEKIEFARLDAANDWRDDNPDALHPDDARRTKTVTLRPDVADDLAADAGQAAEVSRSDEEKKYGQAELTDQERRKLERMYDGWTWGTHGFEAMGAKAALQAEGAQDWLNYYEPGEGQDGALKNLEAGKEAAAAGKGSTAIKGDRVDSDPDPGEIGEKLDKADGQAEDHARKGCESGDPIACDELLREYGWSEEKVEEIKGAAKDLGESPDAVYDPADEFDGDDDGLSFEEWAKENEPEASEPTDDELAKLAPNPQDDAGEMQAELTGPALRGLKKAWSGYKLARQEHREADQRAEKYAAVINGIRAVNGQEPLSFEDLDGWAGGEVMPDDPTEEFPAPEGGQETLQEAEEHGHAAGVVQATIEGFYDPTEEF